MGAKKKKGKKEEVEFFLASHISISFLVYIYRMIKKHRNLHLRQRGIIGNNIYQLHITALNIFPRYRINIEFKLLNWKFMNFSMKFPENTYIFAIKVSHEYCEII